MPGHNDIKPTKGYGFRILGMCPTSRIYDPLVALSNYSGDRNTAAYIDNVNQAASTEFEHLFTSSIKPFRSHSIALLASLIPRQLGGNAFATVKSNSIDPGLRKLAVQASPVMAEAGATLFRDFLRAVHRKDGMSGTIKSKSRFTYSSRICTYIVNHCLFASREIFGVRAQPNNLS